MTRIKSQSKTLLLAPYLFPLAVCPELEMEADRAHDGDEDDDDGDHAYDGGQGGVRAPLVLGPHPGPRTLRGLSVGHLVMVVSEKWTQNGIFSFCKKQKRQ